MRETILTTISSALDNESEAIVQAAIDNVMQSKDQTVVMIAHRLSTIRNADKIAFIAEGKVLEYGSHDDLVERPHGRYKRLFESSRRTASMASLRASTVNSLVKEDDKSEDEEIDWEAKIQAEEAAAFDAKRARNLAKPDISYMMIGSVGAVMAGGVFPVCIFSQVILDHRCAHSLYHFLFRCGGFFSRRQLICFLSPSSNALLPTGPSHLVFPRVRTTGMTLGTICKIALSH